MAEDVLNEKQVQPKRLKKKTARTPSTQQHIPFGEIRDNVVIMKDGTLRSVLLISSLNFALKSEDEQKGIVNGYVQFLNSLEFELQIVIQSRKLNIELYLAKLDQLARQQNNELLRRQTMSYRAFVASLVQNADIMDKKFFVVVPFSPFSKKRKSFFSRLQDVISPASVVKLNQTKFEKYTTELDRRVSSIAAGLQAINLEVRRLDTQALIELYYNTYNPISKQRQRIHNMDGLQIDRSVT